jgi:hypothetical protein
MDERKQHREFRHRLAIVNAEEVTGNVAMTCRSYGIDRPCFYKWLHRYEESGEEGLRDGSSRPLNSPGPPGPRRWARVSTCARTTTSIPRRSRCTSSVATTSQSARQGLEHPHPPRDQQTVQLSAVQATHGPLEARREPLARRPGPRRREALRSAGGDTKDVLPVDGHRRLHPDPSASDLPPNNQKSSVQLLAYLLVELPFPVEPVQADNGADSQGCFHRYLLDRGIGHVCIRPATPRLNAKVERSHRIDNEEFSRMLDGVVIDDSGLSNEKLQEWEDFYNFHGPHGGLGGQTPYERLRQRSDITA